MDEVELMSVGSASTASPTAGDWKESREVERALMMQLVDRGVTQLEMNRLWQELMEEVECLYSLCFCHDVSMYISTDSERRNGRRRGRDGQDLGRCRGSRGSVRCSVTPEYIY